MIKIRRFLLLMLAAFVVLGSCNTAFAEVIAEEIEETILDIDKNVAEELSNGDEVELVKQNLNQAILDEINNNPIDGGIVDVADVQTDSVESSNALTTTSVEEYGVSTASTTASVVEDFEVEPVIAPFLAYSNANEAVSLSTGALVYENTILSLPGRNGMDLDISIRYNSQDAVKTENNDSVISNNYNNFAIGWTFGFPVFEKTKDYYKYSKDTSFVFSDGSSYKVTNDTDNPTEGYRLNLENYLLDDMDFMRYVDPNRYLVIYPDGSSEEFDVTYGTIVSRSDKFANTITFEYSDINNKRCLSKITDSAGRIINIEYTVEADVISKIQFKIGDTVYAELNLERVDSEHGEVDILSSIYSEGLTTSFEYEEKITHIDNSNFAIENYNNGSNFVMTKITYPTGGCVNYEYEVAERSYSFMSPNNHACVDAYEVYKVSRCYENEEKEILYRYQGDYSGYPYSFLRTDHYSEPTGYINDSSIQYHTIVEKNGITTVHTFDYRHNKIREQVYDAYNSSNKYIYGSGNTQWNALVGDRVFRINNGLNTLTTIYTDGSGRQKTDKIPTPSGGIYNVKTQGDLIYVFCVLGIEYRDYAVKIYDTTNEVWYSGDTFFSPATFDEMCLSKIYYTNQTFFTYFILENKLYHLTYKGTWNLNVLTINLPYGTQFTYLCSDAGKIYYKSATTIYEYDLETNTMTSKTFSEIPDSGNFRGFAINGKKYLCTAYDIQEFDYENQTIVRSYSYPFSADLINDVMQKGTDGCLYYFPSNSNSDGIQCIYKFDPEADTLWNIAGYKMFDNRTFSVTMSYNEALITVGEEKSGTAVPAYYRKNRGGFEKVILNGSGETGGAVTRTDYEYNEYNQLTKQSKSLIRSNEKKDLGSERYTYFDKRNVLTSKTDILNNRTLYFYEITEPYVPLKVVYYADTENEVVTINEPTGEYRRIKTSTTQYDDRTIRTSYTYDPKYRGNITNVVVEEIKDGSCNIICDKEYVYDDKNLFVKREVIRGIETFWPDCENKVMDETYYLYEYDDMGNLVSESDSMGATTTYTYNQNNWPEKTIYPDGTYVETVYNICPNNSSITTSYNGEYTTIDYYDGFGRLIRKCELNENGQEKSLGGYDYTDVYDTLVYDANSNLSIYTRDRYGRVKRIRYGGWGESLVTQSMEYNEFDLTKTINYGGKIRKMYYDILGRLIREEQNTAAGLNFVTYEYDHRGNLVKTTDAKGNSVTNTYNDQNQLVCVTDQIGQKTLYEYDGWGNVSKVTYSGGNTISYVYNSAGRLIQTTDVLGNSECYAYDSNNNILAHKDKKGQLTTNTYDRMNRLIRTQTGDILTSYTYGTMGETLTMTDSTGTTNYSYTYNNRLESITTPDNKTISYKYDNGGNVVEVNDYAGNVFAYTYDSMNRMDTISKDGVVMMDYDYTEFGTVEKVTYPEGESSYVYDDAMRIIGQEEICYHYSLPINTYSYEYDIFGNLISQRDNKGTLTYTYDALGRLTSSKEYDGTKTAYTFDSGNNIMTKNIEHPSNYEYRFRQNGTEYEISNLSTHSHTYAYNKANQLLMETESIAGTGDEYNGYLEITKLYDYDANGNMIKKETGGQIDGSVVEYTYNALDQLEAFNAANGVLAYYGYDGNGMRVSKTKDGITTKYYWDRGYVSNEGVGTEITATNCIGPQGIFARTAEEGMNYLLKDSHGDVVNILGENGIDLYGYDYDAYGNFLRYYDNMETPMPEDYSDSNPVRYAGEYTDAESGLIYLRNRYYDPQLGRFINEDPIRDGLNWYVYCGNNPIMFVDPWGLDYDDVIADLSTIVSAKARMLSASKSSTEYRLAYQNAMQAKENISKDVIYIENFDGLRSILSPIVEGDNNSLQSLKDARSSVETAMNDYNRGQTIDDVVFTVGLTTIAIPVSKTVLSTSVGNSSINFAKKAAQHMTEKGRYVPISILKEAIERGAASPDPQGSKAIMYTIEIFKNNIPYQLEVLYDKASNTIFHFKYWR